LAIVFITHNSLDFSNSDWRAYNIAVNIEKLHEWAVTTQQAKEIQFKLAKLILVNDPVPLPKSILALDVSVTWHNQARAAAVVLSYPELQVVEVAVAEGTVEFPYVPGLLSFREVPICLEACQRLSSNPDLVLVDGQGIAHPRRIGMASHLGLFLNLPTIGCAKSPLFGEYQLPLKAAGNYTEIRDDAGQVIGAVVRTKNGVKPLFVSVGHRADLPSSVHWVLSCCRGYRLPDPNRLAHLASRGNLFESFKIALKLSCWGVVK
jgi:deoxyribonuclease V